MTINTLTYLLTYLLTYFLTYLLTYCIGLTLSWFTANNETKLVRNNHQVYDSFKNGKIWIKIDRDVATITHELLMS